MERLTERNCKSFNEYYIRCNEHCDKDICDCGCDKFTEIVRRMGTIEDILGDEYNLGRLMELVQADRDGDLIFHPLKEGDEIYVVLLGRVFPFTVKNAVWCSGTITYKAMHGINLCYVFKQDDIGEKIFLTEEAAEAALKAQKG